MLREKIAALAYRIAYFTSPLLPTVSVANISINQFCLYHLPPENGEYPFTP